MSDEFDDDGGVTWSTLAGPADCQRPQPLAPRLVARLYAAADQSLRSRMLACLLRPLGTLGLAAIASGAFASLLARVTPAGVTVALEDAARFSRDQVFELARFVEQVNPQVLQQITGLFNDNPIGLAAFSAAALTLLAQVARPQRDAAPRTSATTNRASGDDRA